MKRAQQARDHELVASGTVSLQSMSLLRPERLKGAQIVWPSEKGSSRRSSARSARSKGKRYRMRAGRGRRERELLLLEKLDSQRARLRGALKRIDGKRLMALKGKAFRDRIRRKALTEFLTEWEGTHGPISREELRRAECELLGSKDRLNGFTDRTMPSTTLYAVTNKNRVLYGVFSTQRKAIAFRRVQGSWTARVLPVSVNTDLRRDAIMDPKRLAQWFREDAALAKKEKAKGKRQGRHSRPTTDNHGWLVSGSP